MRKGSSISSVSGVGTNSSAHERKEENADMVINVPLRRRSLVTFQVDQEEFLPRTIVMKRGKRRTSPAEGPKSCGLLLVKILKARAQEEA